MKLLKILSLILFSVLSLLIGIYISINYFDDDLTTFILPSKNTKPFDIYSIESLSNADIVPGEINIVEAVESEEKFTSYLFKFTFHPNPEKNSTKTITGQINFPTTSEVGGIVLMLRGYIDQELYRTGDGTKNTAKYFAGNDFVTIAPDFLGYGGSDEEASNIFESRFQTYTTTLSLLTTLENIPSRPELLSGSNELTNQLINQLTISIWGHSNGGQIALTVLEITGKSYPTTLWAPVSKPFPYSILYYTDESEDRGRLIRRELAKFEDDYDTDKYSLTEYLNKINAPMQIHQGTSDDSVPKLWSDTLYKILFDLDLDIDYHVYDGVDHNMRPLWNEAVETDLEFFNNHTHTKP